MQKGNEAEPEGVQADDTYAAVASKGAEEAERPAQTPPEPQQSNVMTATPKPEVRMERGRLSGDDLLWPQLHLTSSVMLKVRCMQGQEDAGAEGDKGAAGQQARGGSAEAGTPPVISLSQLKVPGGGLDLTLSETMDQLSKREGDSGAPDLRGASQCRTTNELEYLPL